MISTFESGYREDADARARRLLICVVVLSVALSAAERLPAVSKFRESLIAPLQPALILTGAFRSALLHSFSGGVAETPDYRSARIASLEKELNDLRATIGLSPLPSKKAIVAGVVGRAGTLLVLEKGRESGITEGDIVLASAEGGAHVVGRVVETARGTSKVRAMIDPSSRIAAKLDDHGGFILSGLGREAQLDYVMREIEVEPGDKIFTSEEGTLFPAGLLLGCVSSIDAGEGNFQKVTVAPAVSFDALRYVSVITE